ncbi:hypothetical protein V8C86DRAFT_802989 [Haematococcus lacustris]
MERVKQQHAQAVPDHQSTVEQLSAGVMQPAKCLHATTQQSSSKTEQCISLQAPVADDHRELASLFHEVQVLQSHSSVSAQHATAQRQSMALLGNAVEACSTCVGPPATHAAGGDQHLPHQPSGQQGGQRCGQTQGHQFHCSMTPMAAEGNGGEQALRLKNLPGQGHQHLGPQVDQHPPGADIEQTIQIAAEEIGRDTWLGQGEAAQWFMSELEAAWEELGQMALAVVQAEAKGAEQLAELASSCDSALRALAAELAEVQQLMQQQAAHTAQQACQAEEMAQQSKAREESVLSQTQLQQLQQQLHQAVADMEQARASVEAAQAAAATAQQGEREALGKLGAVQAKLDRQVALVGQLILAKPDLQGLPGLSIRRAGWGELDTRQSHSSGASDKTVALSTAGEEQAAVDFNSQRSKPQAQPLVKQVGPPQRRAPAAPCVAECLRSCRAWARSWPTVCAAQESS